MKKFLALALSLIFCLGLLASCDGETPTESSSESDRESESQQEEVVYYDEIKNFSLKGDAPDSAVYENYEELLAVLETPLENFDKGVFNENYVLLIKDLEYSAVSGNIGFTNVKCHKHIYDFKTKQAYSNRIVIEFQRQIIKGIDYPTVDEIKDFLIIVPKEHIGKEFVDKNNVIVSLVELEQTGD